MIQSGMAGISNIFHQVQAAETVLIFGAGIGGAQIVSLLKESALEGRIAGFSDNNAHKIHTDYLGYRVYHPDEVHRLFPDALVLVASTAYDKIKEQLMLQGFPGAMILYVQLARMNPEKDRRFIEENIENYRKAYELLEDEKSREIFSDLLHYRISADESWLQKMKPYVDEEAGQYFDKELVRLPEKQYFVDAGAYTGDTIESLVRLWGAGCPCIALEPDSGIFRELQDKITENNWTNVKCFPMAAWSHKETLNFEDTASETGGYISSQGVASVQADSLDSLIGENISVGMIKMDIEGSGVKSPYGSGEYYPAKPSHIGCLRVSQDRRFFFYPLVYSGFGLEVPVLFQTIPLRTIRNRLLCDSRKSMKDKKRRPYAE